MTRRLSITDMMRRLSVMVTVLVMALQPIQAQRRASRSTRPAVVEKSAADILYEELLPSTAKVIVIDSVVCPRDTFVSYLLLGKEAGTVAACNDYFRTEGQKGMHVYVNEFGNKRYYTRIDSAHHTKLYTQDKLGQRWSDEQEVVDFGSEYQDIINPYMMADGQTFYFAARGEHGLGGYDIYVTRYDAAGSRFYKPENIGLPYNSTGDDLGLFIDEFNNIGWLVSDRRQADGQVCVYVLVPQTARQTYDGVGDEQLQRLAALTSIRDTWTDPAACADARNRLNELCRRAAAETQKDEDIHFVINDRLTYHSISQFSTAALRERCAQLLQTRRYLATCEETLQMLRDRYSASAPGDRLYIKSTILATEDEVYALRQTIDREEKEIRNAENKALGL